MNFTKIISLGPLVLGVGLLATPALAQQSRSGGVEGAIQNLMSGSQNRDSRHRNGYDRGYQEGRRDRSRAGNEPSRHRVRPNNENDYGSNARSPYPGREGRRSRDSRQGNYER